MSYSALAGALARNTLLQCECVDCFRARHKLGRFCRGHSQAYYAAGHPNGGSIRLRTWRPYYLEAHAFVVAHLRAEHRAIEAGIRWVAFELENAERPTSYNPVHLGYSAALLRAHRNGVAPTDFLARVVAAYVADDRGREARPLFASDTHFEHQAARLFLHPLPIGPAGWAKRKREPQGPPEVSRIRWGIRAHAFERFNGALGLLASKAAETIISTQGTIHE